MRRRWLGWLVLLGTFAAAISAAVAQRAATEAPVDLDPGAWPVAPAVGEPAPPAEPFSSPEATREVPDYDGRPRPGPDAFDAALGVPRTLLHPVRFCIEHGLRRPLEQAVTRIERERWWE